MLQGSGEWLHPTHSLLLVALEVGGRRWEGVERMKRKGQETGREGESGVEEREKDGRKRKAVNNWSSTLLPEG